MKRLAVVILMIGISSRLFSQSGPGGVGTSTNNVLWLKANAGTSTTTDGAAISSWSDQSGNGVNVSQSTAAQRPTYKSSLMNGMPAIEFDNSTTAGQNDYLTAPDNSILDNTSGYTAFTVLRMKNLNGEARCIFSKRTSIDTDEAFMFFFYGSNNLNLDVDGIGNRFSGGNAYAVNTNYMVGFGFDGSLASASRSKLTEGDSTRKVSSETSSTVPDKPSPLVIGATHTSDDRPFSGYISELILFRTALAVAPQTIIYNYLSAKYDIALLKNDKYAGDNASNGNYDFDVAGVGKEASGSNTDFDASVSKGLKLTVTGGLDNGDYVLVGNNAPANWEKRTDVGGMTGTNNARWERVWYVDVTNTSTSIAADIEFDFSDAGISGGPGAVSNYVLLYRAGLSGNWTELAVANSTPGDRVKFNNYTFVNDGYYTLGTKNYTAGTLPVSLLNFKADKKGNTVKIDWSTASEVNNKFFIVERSADAVAFEEFAKLESKADNGNSNVLLNYSTSDKTPFEGVNYYRLTQVDMNGETRVYPPVSVLVEGEKNISFILYPNPNKGQFTVDFSGIENNHEIKVEIYDLKGNPVHIDSFYSNESEKGSFEIKPSSELKSGQYLVNIEVEGIVYKLKMLVE